MDEIVFEPADIVIYIRGKGMVVKEKSLVAYNVTSQKILALGTEAECLTGRAAENIRVVSPLRQGMIADYSVAVKLFTYLLQKAIGKKTLLKPAIAVCVPEVMTEVEKKAFEDAMYQSGAKDVMLIPLPVEEFVAAGETQGALLREYLKYKTIVGITKDDPERYVTEELGQVLGYAGRNGISAERVGALMRRVSGEMAGGIDE